MAKPLPESQLGAIVAVLAKRPNGATLIEVAAKLNSAPPLRNVQRWLGALVQQNRIVRVGSTNATRYRLPADSAEDGIAFVSPEGAAIQRLVQQPIDTRAVADYRRVSLESYRPNQTWYIPAEARTRLGARNGAPTVPPNGAVLAPGWREPVVFNRVLVDLAWRSGWLEAQASANEPASLSMPDVTSWLSQPESLNARLDVQLVWNQRAALMVLSDRETDVALTYECLTALYAALTKRLQPRATRDQGASASGERSGIGAPSGLNGTLLRTESLRLARTTYRPPADSWVIEACCSRVIGWAAVIADPVEQAFFVFVHLLSLQPFAMLNASMACLAMNIPLLRAGLPPVTFAGVLGPDLLDGLRGVWELNRTELLRDLFIAAYDDSRQRYAACEPRSTPPCS